MIKPSIALLLLLFLTNGYIQIVISSQITRQIVEVKYVGLAMAEFSVVEVLMTLVLGKVADRLGHGVMIIIATVVCCIASFSTLLMNQYQSFWVFIPPALFAIVDTIYQTECISIIGHFFAKDIEDVSATYRLVQGLGSSLCSYITPLFSAGANACSHGQLVVEMVVSVMFSVLSCLLFLCFLEVMKTRKMRIELDTVDNSSIQMKDMV